jgi:hypothetical protein
MIQGDSGGWWGVAPPQLGLVLPGNDWHVCLSRWRSEVRNAESFPALMNPAHEAGWLLLLDLLNKTEKVE